MRFLSLIISVLILSGTRAHANWAQGVSETDLIPIDHFIAHPELRSPILNPIGNRLIISRKNGAVREIQIGNIDISGFDITHKIEVPEDVYRYSFFWADTDRLIVQYTRYISSLPTIDEEPSIEIFAIDYNGQEQLKLFDIKAEPQPKKKSKKRKRKKQTQRIYYQISHLLPAQPDYVLMEQIVETPKKGNDDDRDIVTDVFRLNIRTGELENITPKHNIADAKMYIWLADYNGNIRLGYGEDDQEEAIMLIRRNPESDWIRLDDNELFERGKFDPMFFGKDDDELYVSSSYATGRTAIYRFDIRRGRLKAPIFNDPKISASSLYYSPVKGKVLGVSHYGQTFGRTIYDDDFASLLKEMDQATGSTGEIYLGSQSLDENRYIVWAESERNPGDIWFYDRLEAKAFKIGSVSPAIEPEKMSKMQPIMYSARDGVDIPAYLSLPTDYVKGKPRPAIVMPHGGPHARNYKGWNTWVQFLTNRGYVVLQPNFRGSTGFGSRFTALGYAEWGGDMQQDIADGAKWLVRNGYAQKDSICIVGGSYGGYAALMGIIDDADKFQCAVAWAPVTDIKLILEQDDAYTKKSGWYWRVTGGKKKKELRKASPLFQAKRIENPLLLVHGTEDDVVYIEQSRLLVKALQKQKKSNFEYIELPGLGHSPETEDAERKFLKALESFLTKYNPSEELQKRTS